MELANIAAVFYDMDGTLVDSELNTEPAIIEVCAALGFTGVILDYPTFYGRTWDAVVAALAGPYPKLAKIDGLAGQFHRRFHDLCQENPPPPIPGARAAIVQSSSQVPVAIVSSAYRESIEATIGQLDIAEHVSCYVGAEDFAASKPAPDCFLHAAELLGVDPGRCLVFEDSIAGLKAGRAAGMKVAAILYRSNDRPAAKAIADLAIQDYTELGEGFFATVCNG